MLSIRAKRPTPSDAMPIRSIGRRSRSRSWSRGTYLRHNTTSSTPIGTFTKKMPRQDQYVTNRPPKIGPIIEPIGKMLPKSPTALSRDAPKFSTTMLVADGVNPAPPAACTARSAISS